MRIEATATAKEAPHKQEASTRANHGTTREKIARWTDLEFVLTRGSERSSPITGRCGGQHRAAAQPVSCR